MITMKNVLIKGNVAKGKHRWRLSGKCTLGKKENLGYEGR